MLAYESIPDSNYFVGGFATSVGRVAAVESTVPSAGAASVAAGAGSATGAGAGAASSVGVSAAFSSAQLLKLKMQTPANAMANTLSFLVIDNLMVYVLEHNTKKLF